jgi:trigger factor
LEITLDKKGTTEGLITIKLSPDDYQNQVDEKIRDYARKANLKGFRPGKVPNGVIKRMFGKSILVEEVNQVLSSRLTDYIKENNLKIIGEPLPSTEKARTIDWETQRDFEFEYQIGLVDDFSYDLSSKVKVKSYPIDVDESVIQETIEDLRKRFGKVTYPELSNAGDNLYGELKADEGEFVLEAALLPTDKVSKSEQEKFIGLKKDDKVSIEIEKLFGDPADLAQLLNMGADEAREVKGKYTFTVTNISQSEPAIVNQELFDRVFGKDAVDSEESFRQKVRETISQNYQRETDHFLEHSVEDHLIKSTAINLPEDFLKSWLKATSEGQVTDDVIEREFHDYVRTLKWDLIKSRIAEDNNIRVEADEVRARAKEMIVNQFGGPAVAEQLKDRLDAIADNYLSHEKGQNFMRLYNQLRNEKIMKHIREQITITEKRVSVEEFKKIVAEHQH